MLDQKIKKMQRKERSEIRTVTLTRLGKADHVSLDVLVNICHAMNCDLGDRMEALLQ